jgi:hypothetical protein
MAFFEQPSTQVPHKIHSACSIFSICTIALTSKLIGQLFVHNLQFVQADESATSLSEGHAKRFRIQRPIIMKGAIQQMV